MRDIKYIVLHCTATSQNTTPESILHYWRTELKWRDPGYHFLIKADGTVVPLHPIEKPSNGVKGYNQHSIHISYIGGIDAKGRALDTRTEAQKAAQIALLKKYTAMFPKAEVLGHRDFPGVTKSCPSFDVRSWVRSIALLMVMMITLSSCSFLRSMKKDKTQEHVERKEQKKVEEQTTSENTTVTVKKIDTTVKVAGDSLAASVELPRDTAAQEVDTTITSEGGLSVQVKYQPKTGKLSVAAKKADKWVPVHMEEQTTSHTKTASNRQENSSSTENRTVKHKTVARESRGLPLWAGLLIVGALLWLVYQSVYGKWWGLIFKRKRQAN